MPGAVAGFETAGTVISDAAIELGLVTSLSDPFASTDQNVILLRNLANSLGRELKGLHMWPQFVFEWTFLTEDGVEVYEIPTDFSKLIDGTVYNRNTGFPLIPIGSDDWQYIKATQAATPGVRQYFRIGGLDLVGAYQFHIFPTPGGEETIAYEYVYAAWCGTTQAPNDDPTLDRISANTDYIYYDPHLFVCGLKLKFARAKGLDTAALQDDFDKAFMMATSQAGAAPNLSLSGARGSLLLGDRNIPDNGYGS